MTTNENSNKNFSFNSSNLSGAIDVIVVEDKQGNLRSTNFHVTIGKAKILNTSNKSITIKINGKECPSKLKVNGAGVGYFEITEPVEDHFTQFKKKSSQNVLNELGNEIEQHRSQTSPNAQSQKKFSVNPFQLCTEKDNLNGIKAIEISLSAHLIKEDMSRLEMEDIFDRHRLLYDEFLQNPHEIINNSNLLIRINHKIYDAFFGIPQLLSLNVFQKELDQETLTKMKQSKAMTSPFLGHPIVSSTSRKTKATWNTPDGFFNQIPLHQGKNILEYTFIGNFGKEFTISARLFFYRYQKTFRVVISDIDGTITKSDVLGHLMPIIGHDWTHSGIAQLFSNLVQRGYVIIYLSARNIGQSKKTRKYLESIRQDEYRMPEGPVLTSTDGLFTALNREIIQKTPHLFKIKMLKAFYKVFGNGQKNPLYAGFGNKETDAIAYSTVAIETKKIFTINEKSEIKVLKNGDVVSFTNLNTTIDETFPIFDPQKELIENPFEIELRNQTSLNVVHQSLFQPLFKDEKKTNFKD